MLKKQQIVKNLEKIYKSSNSIIIIHYHGFTVADITSLRKKLKAQEVDLKIVKNTLSKIAMKNINYSDAAKMFQGPVAIAYSMDIVAAAAGIVEFKKQNNNLKIIGGIINDRIIDTKEVMYLAKLPSLNQLRSNIISLIKSPLLKIVQTINEPKNSLVRVIKIHSNKN